MAETRFRDQRESYIEFSWIEEGRTFFFCLTLVSLLSQASVSSGSSVPFQSVRNGGSYVETLIPQCSQIIGLVTRIQVQRKGNVSPPVFIASPFLLQHVSFHLGTN